MRYPYAHKLGPRPTSAGFKLKPGQTCSLEFPPISGYSPFPESYWLIILAVATVASLLLAWR